MDAEVNLRHLALQERGEISSSLTESRADGAFHRRRDTDVFYDAAALLLCSYHRWIPAFVDATYNTNEEKEKQEQGFWLFLSFHFTFMLPVSCGRRLNCPTASRRKDVDSGMIHLHGAACGSAAGERRILSLFLLFSSCSSSTSCAPALGGTVLF